MKRKIGIEAFSFNCLLTVIVSIPQSWLRQWPEFPKITYRSVFYLSSADLSLLALICAVCLNYEQYRADSAHFGAFPNYHHCLSVSIAEDLHNSNSLVATTLLFHLLTR